MSPIKMAIIHINASLPRQIDEKSIIECIKGKKCIRDWEPHILSFFLETPIPLIHRIVMSGVFTFLELYESYLRWDTKGYCYGGTTKWLEEMAYLEMGKAYELGADRFV